MTIFVKSLLTSAVAGALTTVAVPAFAQTSPYDAEPNPSIDRSITQPGPSGLNSASAVRPASSAPSGAYGTVVSATPITSQFTTRQQRCYDQPGVVRAQPSGLGAVVGAVVGGLAGNTIGAGSGRALATGAGVIGGAIAGGAIEQSNAPTVPVTTTHCGYPVTTESRIVGFDVVYEFNGQRYTTRTQQDPGPRIALDVRPTGAASDDTPRAAAQLPPAPYPAYAYPAYAYPAPVYGYPATVYPYPPVSIGFGFRGHWH